MPSHLDLRPNYLFSAGFHVSCSCRRHGGT